MSRPAPSGSPDRHRPRRRRRDPRKVAILTAVVCLLLTLATSWIAARVDANSEHRLLQGQTQQAASVLSAAVSLIEQPLHTALSVQEAVGPARAGQAFAQSMAGSVGAAKLFVSASLWERHGDRVTLVASTGAAPMMSPTSPETQAYVLRAFASSTTTTRQTIAGGQARIAWALADPATGFAVYAERAIPADRRAPAARNNTAFADIRYAIYLGDETTAETLSTTDADPGTLPLRGNTARASIPFGDTKLTLVTTPRRHLGSSLSRWLPLGLLLGGLLLTLVAAWAAHRTARGRSEAEEDAATITTLYEKVETLYGQQRDLFVRLQRALLPQAHPRFADVEIASQYVAGARGIDIGGDWFSVIALDEHRFGFVIGDVSGHGIDTVAVMAQARFTVRAYLADGQSPAVVLEKCSHQFDIEADGHLVTLIAGIGDARTGEVTMANAGHPVPLLIDGGSDGGADGEVLPVQVTPGRPLGVGPARYRETTLRLAPGSTLFFFTDGLVERRGEDIDTGLGRLAATLREAAAGPLEELVGHAVGTLRVDDATDDVAALALRWAGVR